MPNLEVGKTRFGEKLEARYSNTGIKLQFEYPSGKNFPSLSLNLSWAQWERFIAWVELQRKEEALKENDRIKMVDMVVKRSVQRHLATEGKVLPPVSGY